MADRQRLTRTLEHQPSGQTSTWVNPDTGKRFRTVPGTPRKRGDQPCRPFTLEVEGIDEPVHGTACRRADGDWGS